MDKSDRTIDATKSSITIERCRGRERGTERRERMRRIESKTDVNLVPKRQVDLRVATSFRPLLPLNISAMGRAGKLPREDREMDDPASIIYCVTLAARQSSPSLSFFVFRAPCKRSYVSPLSLSVPYIIAHYSYDEI